MSGFADTPRLGLIGGNITATRSPALHVLCGLASGLNVTSDRLFPSERGRDFAGLLAQCADLGLAGINVTYPFKVEAAAAGPAGDPVVAAMGAAFLPGWNSVSVKACAPSRSSPVAPSPIPTGPARS